MNKATAILLRQVLPFLAGCALVWGALRRYASASVSAVQHEGHDLTDAWGAWWGFIDNRQEHQEIPQMGNTVALDTPLLRRHFPGCLFVRALLYQDPGHPWTTRTTLFIANGERPFLLDGWTAVPGHLEKHGIAFTGDHAAGEALRLVADMFGVHLESHHVEQVGDRIHATGTFYLPGWYTDTVTFSLTPEGLLRHERTVRAISHVMSI